MSKQHVPSLYHTAIVDVAAPASAAVSEIRKDLWEKANVTLHSANGPAGIPQCAVRLGTRRMIKFLAVYYDCAPCEWLLTQCEPPIPVKFLNPAV